MPEKIKLKIAGKYCLLWLDSETHYSGEADWEVPVLCIQFLCGTVTAQKVYKIFDAIDDKKVKIPFEYDKIKILNDPVYS